MALQTTSADNGRTDPVSDEADPLAIAVTAAVDATLARMAAQQTAQEQLERRRDAIRSMHQHGMSKEEISRTLYSALQAHGLSSDQLRHAGITHASIIKILA